MAAHSMAWEGKLKHFSPANLGLCPYSLSLDKC